MSSILGLLLAEEVEIRMEVIEEEIRQAVWGARRLYRYNDLHGSCTYGSYGRSITVLKP